MDLVLVPKDSGPDSLGVPDYLKARIQSVQIQRQARREQMGRKEISTLEKREGKGERRHRPGGGPSTWLAEARGL